MGFKNLQEKVKNDYFLIVSATFSDLEKEKKSSKLWVFEVVEVNAMVQKAGI